MAWINKLSLLVAVLSVGFIFYPYPLPVQLQEAGKDNKEVSAGNFVTILRAVHLLVFATSFGTSLWVSFIGGVIMFRNLPRHQFGNLQGKLFPAYFRLSAFSAAIGIGVLATLHPWPSASAAEKLQFGILVAALVCHLFNLLVLEPLTTKVMRQRHKIEKDENIGSEVGISKNKEAAQRNPALAKINKKFGMIHGISSLVNLSGFVCITFHGWYLAKRLVI